MSKHLFAATFLVGALAIAWVGASFIGTNLLALTMTVVIATTYVFGALELRQFRHATASLNAALAAIPDALDTLEPWMQGVHPTLRNAVRLRVEGERSGLPGPALTPYLVGLLVMLGMLGTFLGMVVTLSGTGFALEGGADLAAIKSALAAPIKGLGLAFGTSVAGVAASAMLGLLAALCRRERAQAAQRLDSASATTLRRFSLAQQRQEAFQALQAQTRALPAVVDTLQAMMAQMERLSVQLNDRLLSNQERFHGEAKALYTDLARAVDGSLRESLMHSAEIAGASIKPVVTAAMAEVAADANRMHERLVDTTQQQLDGLATRFGATADRVADTWSQALDTQQRNHATLNHDLGETLQAFTARFDHGSAALIDAVRAAQAEQHAEHGAAEQQRLAAWSDALGAITATLKAEWQASSADTLARQQDICRTLAETAQEISAQANSAASTTLGELARLTASADAAMQARITAEADWMQQHAERMDRLTTQLQHDLGALRDDEARRGEAAVARLGELQTALTLHLTTLGTALEEPITRLIHTASEAPRAAAEVIGQLRQEISTSMARDNALLEERSRIMATLNSLLEAINHASAEQRTGIDALVANSAEALNQASRQFAAQVSGETDTLREVAAQVSSSAIEVSSLGEAFGLAVQAFADGNEKLIANLQRIEAAMDKSMSRSDEQLAYYVAQAREVIDLSIMSQKEIVEELRQLPANAAALASEAG